MDRVKARRLHDAKEPRVMRIFMEIRRILAAVKIGVVELRMSNENTGLFLVVLAGEYVLTVYNAT